MINNDRNNATSGNPEEHKNPATSSADDLNEPLQQASDGVPDLDGDGIIGNTGGFYGGTSYVGSNYSTGWNDEQNADQNEGNFGASGQRDPSDNNSGTPNDNS